MHHFATYFDSNYLPRALALYDSLRRHAGEFRLHVLCLDAATYVRLSGAGAPEWIIPVRLSELEAADPELFASRETRSRVEYYFTCTAAFQVYLLDRHPEIELLTYVDADLYFYGSPAPIFDELGEKSILIVSHRFPKHLKHLEAFGLYNVGLLIFRNDPAGRECLAWWRARCIEWCYDRLEDGKFADQKYLDDWPRRFSGVVVLAHKGANLAPWNIGGYRIALKNGTVMVDENPLIFYHFHKLKMLGPNLVDTGITDRRVPLNRAVRLGIFAPYIDELRRVTARSGSGGIASIRGGGPAGLLARIRLAIDHKMLLTIGTFTIPLYLGGMMRPVILLRRKVAAIVREFKIQN